MQVPTHPMIVHLPIALTIILPFLIIAFALMIKSGKMSREAWMIIIGVQLLTTITGYVSLETGETEEEVVERVVDRKIIHEHEEAAEVFVGFTVVALILSIAVFFIKEQMQFNIHIVITAISLVASYLAIDTGRLGGELVYKYGAASAHVKGQQLNDQGLLPTPGQNTSESSQPVEENESLKADENDYGNEDDYENSEDEFRQED